jgi:LPS sulfotransferase NodH
VSLPLPRSRFVLLAAPRTGSNWLCTLLDSHPEILCHHELFNPEGIHYALSHRGGEIDLGTLEERERDPEAVLAEAWRQHLGHPVVGFKLNRGQDARVFRAVLADPGVKKIVVRRGNRLKTFVSEQIATRTGEWESYPGRALVSGRHPLAVDLTELRAQVAANTRYYDELEAALAANGQMPLTVLYEELHQEAEQRRILSFLGADPEVVLRGATRKQNSRDLRDLISNFASLAQELRGTDLERELFSLD